METLWWLLVQVVWLVWAVASWLAGYLVWLAFWVLAPVILMAIVAVRVAEYALSPEVVRAWVKRISLKFGAGAWRRAHRLLFALGVMPIRVLGWLMLYSLSHVLISLFWTPRWSPWQRAWDRRWRRRIAR
jgi:hypothetical protein